MQLKYVRIVLGKIRVVVLALVVTLASVCLFSLIQAPIYRSSVVMNIWPARLDWSLQNTILGLLRNYIGIIQSRETAQEVIDRLQLDLTPDELQSQIEVESDELTFTVTILAEDYDPLIARDIAQTMAEAFIEGIDVKMVDQNRENRVEISIRDDARVGELFRPDWGMTLLAGLVFGLAAGVCLALLINWLESDVLHTARDVEQHIGMIVLATIPRSTGARVVDNWPPEARKSG